MGLYLATSLSYSSFVKIPESNKISVSFRELFNFDKKPTP